MQVAALIYIPNDGIESPTKYITTSIKYLIKPDWIDRQSCDVIRVHRYTKKTLLLYPILGSIFNVRTLK